MDKLKNISPSKVYSYYECPFRISFKEKNGFKANYGNVLHKMYELAVKGRIEDFEIDFARELEIEENKDKEQKINLQKTTKDFLVKKYRMKKIIENLSSKKKNISLTTEIKPEKIGVLSEFELASNDEIIKGRVDLIRKFENEIAIVDFKTGNVLDNEGSIKKEYEWQLKIYYCLYFEKNNKLPTKLILETLYGEEEIPIDLKDCEETYNKAKELFNSINSAIEQNNIESLAKPDEEKCKNCYDRKICTQKFQ